MIPIQVTVRDPIVSRDSRPFSAGGRMRPVDWPIPSMVAGCLRTLLGNQGGKDFSGQVLDDLKNISTGGLFPFHNGQLYFPAPADAVRNAGTQFLRTSPQSALVAGGGADWPVNGLAPVGLTFAQAADNFKPGAMPAWWRADQYAQWLVCQASSMEIGTDANAFFMKPGNEERTHVAIEPNNGVAADGQIFSSSALNLTHLKRFSTAKPDCDENQEIQLATFARSATSWIEQTANQLNALSPLGGERRLARWQQQSTMATIWDCPETVKKDLAKTSVAKVRMVLASPAIFTHGWHPGWLKKSDLGLEGTVPETDVKVRLKGAAIGRWRTVSGWSYEKHGPKALKRTVPAGGVYFFEIVSGQASALASRWLSSVCDDSQAANDGFGLATWGTW